MYLQLVRSCRRIKYTVYYPGISCINNDCNLFSVYFSVKNVVGLGEGAGANIIARFAVSSRGFWFCLIFLILQLF